MLLVIFGAGASAGCFDKETSLDPNALTPVRYDVVDMPLARDLVEDRRVFRAARDTYPAAGGVLAELRPLLHRGADIETELERMHTEAADDPRLQRQLVAFRFYLRKAIYDCELECRGITGSTTHYSALLRHLHRWQRMTDEPVLIVTFNYDTILDRAWETHFDVKLDNFDAFITDPMWRYVKPHGSLRWGRWYDLEVEKWNNSTTKDAIIDRFDEKLLTREFVANVASPEEVKRRARAIVPALAVPTRGKALFECPDSHIALLAEQLPRAARALVVGWRAGEQVFLNLWAKSNAALKHLILVGKDHADAQATADAIISAGFERGIEVEPLDVDFTGLMTDPARLMAVLGRA